MTRRLALWLTFATGLSGLVYQVTWERYLARLLGSHGEATAAVLGLFLGGLAGGYALFGEVTRRRVAAAAERGERPHLLALYGAVEAGIGLWALGFPFLFAALRGLSVHLPELPVGPAFAIDVLLAAVLLIPPTLLMGGTIPILTQGLARGTEDATRVHALVYGINTAGAVVGALLAGFWLIAWLGLPGTLWAMALVNGTVGLCFWRARDAGAAPLPGATDESGDDAPERLLPYLIAALLSGFAMMTLEIVAIRIGALALGSSEYAFSVVVAVFVGCIAAGSLFVGALPRVPSGLLVGSQVALVAILFTLYSRVPYAPYGAHRLRVLFTVDELAFVPYFGLVFLAGAACLAPAVLLSGATLPLIFDHLRRRYGELGAAAGRLYSWNTVGSLLGALVGGYLLLLWLDLHHVFRIATGALGVGAALLAYAQLRGTKWSAGGVVVVPVALAGLGLLLVGLPGWSPEHLAAGMYRARTPLGGLAQGPDAVRDHLFRGRELVFYDDDPGVSVAVVQFETRAGDLARGLIVNGKNDSGTDVDLTTTVLLGILPALLAEDPRTAFVVGLGTAVTSGELAQLESMEQVTVAEISLGVARAAPLFDFASHDASHHPRVRIARSDAFRALQRSHRQYDLIVSEPSNPWVTGVEMLYTEEFLTAARSRMAPGGIYCQWMHQYETDAATIALVLRTFSAVFDHVAVWYAVGNDLLILGSAEALGPDTLLARIRERAARPDFAAALDRARIPGIPALLAHELIPLGALDRASLPGPLHRLEHPLLSHLAAQAFFRGQTGSLPFTGYGEVARVGREAALLPRHLASLPEEDRREARAIAVDEACRRRSDVCVPFLAAWGSRDPDDPAFQARIAGVGRMRPDFGPRMSASLVESAAWLLPQRGRQADYEEPASASPAQASSVTRIYRQYYQHAFPFDPERLIGAWDTCHEPAAECAEGRAAAVELVTEGAVDGPAP